jgi:hypothetical protein
MERNVRKWWLNTHSGWLTNGIGSLPEKSFEVTIELVKELVHIQHVTCTHYRSRGLDPRSSQIWFRRVRRRLNACFVPEFDIVPRRSAKLAQRAASFGRIAIVEDGRNEITVVAVVAGDGDHPESLFAPNDLQIIGQEPSVAHRTPIYPFKNILFYLKL